MANKSKRRFPQQRQARLTPQSPSVQKPNTSPLPSLPQPTSAKNKPVPGKLSSFFASGKSTYASFKTKHKRIKRIIELIIGICASAVIVGIFFQSNSWSIKFSEIGGVSGLAAVFAIPAAYNFLEKVLGISLALCWVLIDDFVIKSLIKLVKQYKLLTYTVLSNIVLLVLITNLWLVPLISITQQRACLQFDLLFCSNGLVTRTIFAPDPNHSGGGSYVTIGITNGSNASIFNTYLTNIEEKDVIGRISQENKRYENQPHMDLVLVTMLSQTPDDLKLSYSIGLADTRGAYLAMKQYNDMPSHLIKMRLLIANIGTANTVGTTVPIVMDQILLLAQQDRSLRGIVGLPLRAVCISFEPKSKLDL